MAKGRAWTRRELMIAISLYCRLPFGQMHKGNQDIISLASRLDRTPGSIALKLGNFAAIDPTLDRKGASHCSKLDRQVWGDFFDDWTMALTKSEELFVSSYALDKEGRESMSMVKTRSNQDIFRKMVLASYDNKCALTGLSIPELLVASHIVPWSKNEKVRMNPCNGICLNSLHDKAFDRGIMTFDEEMRVVFSSRVPRCEENRILLKVEGHQLHTPKKFAPLQEFLGYHRENIFVA